MTGRNKQDAVAYLRRSTSRQEASLPTQCEWAIAQSKRHEVKFDVLLPDLNHMLRNGLHKHKCIYLDDAITGADIKRPGLRALIADVAANQNISHLFVYKRDRLGRPEDPLEMMVIESQLTRTGLTIVFNDEIANPVPQGETDITYMLRMLLGYHEGGEYLRSLAERTLAAQRRLASEGFSTGGCAPYGFARYLVGPDGTVGEELPKGKSVRSPGYHVLWLPKDAEKIAVWISILELKEKGLGTKKIANFLNGMSIPSPAFGTYRKDHGVKHLVSGKWSPNTVASLCRNPLILGIKEFGRQSRGRLRRLGQEGPRLLDENDRTQDGKLKVIENEAATRIVGPIKSNPQFDKDRWERIQAQSKQRSKSQKGVPRTKDPSRYPLSCRVVDLTDGCGALLYGVTSGDRRLYKCGRYMKSAGGECHHNLVDAEALLRFLLKTLSLVVDRHGGRNKLRKLLEKKARINGGNPTAHKAQLAEIDRKIAVFKDQLATAEENLAFEKDGALRAIVRRKYLDRRQELERAEALKAQVLAGVANACSEPEQKIDAALSLLDQINVVAQDAKARQDIRILMERLGVWIGLSFGEGIKGKKRRIRRLLGGEVSFGGYHLPVPLHGRDNRDHRQNGEANVICDGSAMNGPQQGDGAEKTDGPLGQCPQEGLR